MANYNLCFIGAGKHASNNIYPATLCANTKIVAIATRDVERSKTALLRFGSTGTPYGDYHEMLAKEECDGVVVVAQAADQTQIALDCLKAGKNVFVEKPLGWNPQEAQELADAAEKSHAVLMVGFMKRYAPCYQKLKDLIVTEELGKARSFQANFCVNGTAFCKTEEEYIKFAAIHYVDLFRFLFGEVADVCGYKNVSGSLISESFSLKFENGVVGSVYFANETGWSRESENLSVTFENGFASAEEINKVVVHRTGDYKGVPWQNFSEEDTVFTTSMAPMSGTTRDLYMRGFVGEIEHFIDCCQSGNEPLSSGADNVKTMELCERILKSLQ